MSPEQFVATLAALRFENTFNPYAHRCSKYDVKNAPELRAKILTAMLEAAVATGVDSIWIGRDLGHRGGRRTGLALTDDVHFEAHIQRWGCEISRPTLGPVCSERTATVIWDLLSQIDESIFLWNVFPLHPFPALEPFSNRSHNAIERKAGEEILRALIRLLKPRRLIAIGNDAAASAKRIEHTCEVAHVRHPSYGGQTEFTNAIQLLYGLGDRQSQTTMF
jgi:hypothetical protein